MKIECWSIKGALIANILHGIYAVYDDTKNGPPLKRVPTAANYEKRGRIEGFNRQQEILRIDIQYVLYYLQYT